MNEHGILRHPSIILLRIVSCVLLTLSIAPTVRAAPPSVEIVLLVDHSSSMRGRAGDLESPNASRLQTVQQLVPRYLQSLSPQDRVGLLLVGERCGEAGDVLPISTSRSSIVAKVATLTPQGTTPLNEALQKTPTMFSRRRDVHKRVVLFTDGADSCGGRNTCDIARSIFLSDGIHVDVVALGQSNDAMLQAMAQCVTQQTSGRYVTLESSTQVVRDLVPGSDHAGHTPLSILPPSIPWLFIVVIALVLMMLLSGSRVVYIRLFHHAGWRALISVLTAVAWFIAGLLGAVLVLEGTHFWLLLISDLLLIGLTGLVVTRSGHKTLRAAAATDRDWG